MKTRLDFFQLLLPCKSAFMCIKKIQLLAFVCILASFVRTDVQGQVSAYTFSQNAGTYTAGATLGTPASFFGTSWNDDAAAYVLPFDFTYNGVTYTTSDGGIGVSANGWVAFSNATTFTFTGTGSGGSYVSGGNPDGLYLNGTSNNNGIAAFNANLAEQSFATFTGNRTSGSYTLTGIAAAGFTNIQVGTRLSGTGITSGTVVIAFNSGAGTITMSNPATSGSSSSTTVTPRSSVYGFYTGTAPNRTMVIQWTQVRRSGVTGDNFTFQVRINEGGGYAANQTVEVVYGTCTTSSTSFGVQAGLRGSSNADFNARTTTTDWTATTAAATNTDRLTESSTVFPPGGRTYIWTPAAASAPLCGTIHVGTAQPYPYNRIANAINYLNYNGVSCDVTFLLDDASYTTPGETFPIRILPYPGSGTYTVTLKPKAGGAPTIFTPGSATASTMFDFRSSNNFIIDGSNSAGGTTKDMTIFNNYTSGSTIRFINGATNNTVKNSIIDGENTLTGVIHISTSNALTGNNNNTIQNNDVTYGLTKPITGIYNLGTSGLPNTNTTITQNNISNFYFSGIEDDGNSTSTVISYNKIFGTVNQASSTGLIGIYLTDVTILTPQILSNTIYDLKSTNTSSSTGIVAGIDLYDTGPGLCVVSNNMISLAGTSSTAPGTAIYGIRDQCDVATVNIYHNTVSINGTANSSNSGSYVYLKNALGTSVVKNNIFTNTRVNAGTGKQYTIAKVSTGAFTFDYNDIYSSGNARNVFGYYLTADRASLAIWQTATSQDANSISTFVNFTSTTDLHIVAPSTTSLNNLGTAVSITADIDDQTRNGLTPDMGADEFVAPNTGSWVGKTSIDWLTATNWEANVIPVSTTDVSITGGYTFMPTIATTQAVKNLSLSAPGTPPLLTLNNATLQINGTFSRSGGSINGSNGTLEMNGTSAQSIPANSFQSNNLKNLIISNTNAVTGVTLGGTLDVYRSVTFGASGLKLTTGGFLTFKSTATETAWLGDMTGKTITGDATVERYIPNHAKAWQLLAIPTSGQTIKQAWQEGSAAANSNPNAGFGTQISGAVAGATTHPTPGFDVLTSTPSMKIYDSTTNAWIGVTNTGAQIANPRGYIIFVRGDRSVTTAGGAATATILRTKGTLYTPANPPAVTNMAANTFQSIGNPYASAINIRQLYLTGISGGVQDIYYVWDPKLTTGPFSTYGYGAYQTLSWNGTDYDVTPGGGSYPTDVTSTIESGQAFFVHAPSAIGSVTFSEGQKTSNSNLVYKLPAKKPAQLRTKLNVITSNRPVLIDGNLIQFDASYSNAIDMDDATKFANSTENLGLSHNNKILAVERRAPVQLNDTIFYNLGQLRVQQYQLEFIPEKLSQPGLSAFLVDRYLHTDTPVSLVDTTRFMFNVMNIPGSYAANRFMLVFKKGKRATSVMSTTIDAKRNNDKSIGVDWKVKNESNLQQYIVERSADGVNFSSISVMAPLANDGTDIGYTSLDPNPLDADNYYRIKMLDADGETYYTNVAKVSMEKTVVANTTPSIKLYPNPVTDKTMRIQFVKQVLGKYNIQLINKLGQTVYNNNIQLTSSDIIINVKLDETIAAGSYQLNIIFENGTKTTQQIIIQ